jgi:uncharacterized membrane protein YhaH (DUF805 family)
MFNNPFSFEGRIRRSEYGISFILFVFTRVVITLILSSAGNGIILLSSIPLLWFLWAQGAKRCHDLGNSGWFQIIPFYGLWMIFQDGVSGVNQYGENPKDDQNNSNNTFTQPIKQNQSTNTITNSGYPGQYGGGHNATGQNQNNQNNIDSKNSDGYQNGSLYK